ncbi:MAG: metal ABC transporter permease [Candidatus Azobacteroides sp.]|nr:metal ABC transporter permease [Candidatus Azobacteroides sp.]
MELFQYTFFQNAVLGAFLTSIACGIVGTYVVTRRLVFISGGITHASFGGLGLGVFLGINPIISGLVFAILSALGVEWMSKKQGVREDSAIAVFWALGMAIGVIFIFLTPGFAPNLSTFLFGNILIISQTDLLLNAILVILLLLFFGFFFYQILFIAFDSEFARSLQMPVRFIEYGMMFFIAVTIVLASRMIGIILLISLLTVPQITASLFTCGFKKIIYLSIGIGFTGCITGLLLSAQLNVPSGAFIIFVLVLIYLACKLLVTITKKKSRERASVS